MKIALTFVKENTVAIWDLNPMFKILSSGREEYLCRVHLRMALIQIPWPLRTKTLDKVALYQSSKLSYPPRYSGKEGNLKRIPLK